MERCGPSVAGRGNLAGEVAELLVVAALGERVEHVAEVAVELLPWKGFIVKRLKNATDSQASLAWRRVDVSPSSDELMQLILDILAAGR